jgi:hypothetical protein
LATKSVSQFTSIKTPICAPGWMYAPIKPSVADRPAFLAAFARPFSRRMRRALSMSPADSVTAF